MIQLSTFSHNAMNEQKNCSFHKNCNGNKIFFKSACLVSVMEYLSLSASILYLCIVLFLGLLKSHKIIELVFVLLQSVSQVNAIYVVIIKFFGKDSKKS